MRRGRNNERRLAEFYDPPLDQDAARPEAFEGKKEPARDQAALERHYSVNEIAKIWQLDPKMIRRIFGDEPGVVTIGSEESRFRRPYRTLRIPESVLMRVHRRIRKAG